MYTLLVGVLTFCSMAVLANKVGLQSRLRASAYQLAFQQAEMLKTTSFDNLQAVGDTSFNIPAEVIASLPGSTVSSTGTTNSKYEVTSHYRVESVTTTQKKITVRIRWRNAATPESNATRPWSEVRLTTVTVKPGSITAPEAATSPAGTIGGTATSAAQTARAAASSLLGGSK
ncbi:MAG: hypothetical protein KDC26_01280 [Armatimonadetes bacterium]|nr:hypothetical protein [Armatimonadota bacterium]